MMVKPPALLMTRGKLQTFFAPQPFDFLVIDAPTVDAQKLPDLAVAISAILLGKLDQGQTQCIIVWRLGLVTQRTASKADDITGPPFRGAQLLANMDNGTT